MEAMTVWRIALWALVAFAAFMILILSERPARAQPMPQCGPWPAMKKWLADEHKESATGAGGIISDKAIIEVYASVDGATFTIVARATDGSACILGSGKDWQPGAIVTGEGA